MKSARLPIANGIPARIGDIQWTSGLAVQANQKSLIMSVKQYGRLGAVLTR